MNIIIEEPPEYNPVDLIHLAKHASPSLKYADFAIAFKCEICTVGRWMCGAKKPSKAYRVWAAELKRRWDL